MSLFNNATVACPHCGESREISWAASVNAVRRPDLRAAILDRSFQAEPCESCGTQIRLPPHLTYVDMKRGDWILVYAADELPEWTKKEAEAQALFNESFGPAAPAASREMAEGVSPRIAFGWPALREKLICTELGLDDVTLEILKIAMMKTMGGVTLGGPTLRLVKGDSETLTFDVVDDATEASTLTTEGPRGLYDYIAADATTWAPLRDRFANTALVDLTRFTVGG